MVKQSWRARKAFHWLFNRRCCSSITSALNVSSVVLEITYNVNKWEWLIMIIMMINSSYFSIGVDRVRKESVQPFHDLENIHLIILLRREKIEIILLQCIPMNLLINQPNHSATKYYHYYQYIFKIKTYNQSNIIAARIREIASVHYSAKIISINCFTLLLQAQSTS